MNALMYSNYVIAEVECRGVTAQAMIGRYRLLFDLRFNLKKWESGQIRGYVPYVTGLRATAKVNGALLGTAPPTEEDFLSPVDPATPGTVTVTRTFALDLDGRILEAVERAREGREADFELKVAGTASILSLEEGDARDTLFGSLRRLEPLLIEPRLARAEVRHRVSQSDWIELIDRMGYGRTLLFEIPWPEGAEDGLADAVSHFEDAQAEFLSGSYTMAVVELRKSLESACSAIDFEKSMNKVWSKVSGEKKMRDMELGDRFLFAWSSVRHLANSAAHPGVSYSREEARYILGMGALALSLVANAPGVLNAASEGSDGAG